MTKQTRSIATRQALLEAAERLFAARGYLAVSVDEMCRAAGVSKGAFYHHFPSKQAVFLALLEDWLQRLQKALETEIASHEDLPHALLAMSAHVGQVWEENSERWPLFLDFWSQAVRETAVWEATIAPYRQFEMLFTEWLAHARQSGTPLPIEPRTAARILLALALGTLLQGMLLPEETDWGAIAYQGVLTLLRGWGMLAEEQNSTLDV